MGAGSWHEYTEMCRGGNPRPYGVGNYWQLAPGSREQHLGQCRASSPGFKL